MFPRGKAFLPDSNFIVSSVGDEHHPAAPHTLPATSGCVPVAVRTVPYRSPLLDPTFLLPPSSPGRALLTAARTVHMSHLIRPRPSMLFRLTVRQPYGALYVVWKPLLKSCPPTACRFSLFRMHLKSFLRAVQFLPFFALPRPTQLCDEHDRHPPSTASVFFGICRPLDSSPLTPHPRLLHFRLSSLGAQECALRFRQASLHCSLLLSRRRFCMAVL